jgi:hypothetical protein
VPVTDNDMDLGTSSLEFKDLYNDGTANIDRLIADTADINAGTIDNTVVGATTAAAATFTTLTSTGSTTLNGTTVPASKTLVVTTDKLSVHAATSSSELAGIISDETGSGALVFATSPTLVTPVLGTPSSATLTNATGLPIASGVSGLGTGVATFLGTPSSANLASAVTDETGTGALVFANSPTLVTPTLGTPASATLTNATGLPLSTGVTGTLPIANGGTSATTAAGARTALLPSFTGNGGKIVAVNSGATDIEYITVSGTGTVTSLDVSGGTTGLTTSGGPVTTAGTITLAGTLAVANGGTGITTLDSGRVPFGNGTSAFGSNANLIWDNTNSRLGVATASPAHKLDITGQGRATLGWAVSTSDATFTPMGGTNAVPTNGLGYDAFSSRTTISAASAVVIYANNAERIRFEYAGQIGLGGASYGTSGQVLTSGGSDAAATWTTVTSGSSTGLVRAIAINCILP